MAELTDLVATEEKSFIAILDYMMIKMQQALTQTPANSSFDNFGIHMGIKLNGHNYALWSQVLDMYIVGKDKHGYTWVTLHSLSQQIQSSGSRQPKMLLSSDDSSARWSHL